MLGSGSMPFMFYQGRVPQRLFHSRLVWASNKSHRARCSPACVVNSPDESSMLRSWVRVRVRLRIRVKVRVGVR